MSPFSAHLFFYQKISNTPQKIYFIVSVQILQIILITFIIKFLYDKTEKVTVDYHYKIKKTALYWATLSPDWNIHFSNKGKAISNIKLILEHRFCERTKCIEHNPLFIALL